MHLISSTRGKFTALVLAGRRPEGDALAKAHNVPSKAFIPLHGKPMISYVINALNDAGSIAHIIISTPDAKEMRQVEDIARLVSSGKVTLVESKATPCLSILDVLQNQTPYPLLLTTADHPLLTSKMIDDFCKKCENSRDDLGIAFIKKPSLDALFPQNTRTFLSFRDGKVKTCNLFAFNSPASRKAAELWVKIENKRKKPLKVMRVFGMTLLVMFALRLLSLASGLKRAGKRIGLQAMPVFLEDANAAIDVDKVSDFMLVHSILAKK